MAMRDLATELVSEIVSILSSDLESLKSAILVNRQLGVVTRGIMFGRYWVRIPSFLGSHNTRGPKSHQFHSRRITDFLSLLDRSPDLACLIRRLRLDRVHLAHHHEGLSVALRKFVNVRHFEIHGNPDAADYWMRAPHLLQDVLLNVIFPGLTRFIISTNLSQLPADFLNYAPLLTCLEVQRPLRLHPALTCDRRPVVLAKIRELTLRIEDRFKRPETQTSSIRLVQGRLDTTLALTMCSFLPCDSQLLIQGLGRFVQRLSILGPPRMTIPFQSLPVLQTLFVELGSNFMDPIRCLNQSFQDQSCLPLLNLVLLFPWCPFDERHPDSKTRNLYGKLDAYLLTSCHDFKSLHVTFNIERTKGTVSGKRRGEDRAWNMFKALFPQCLEKGILSLEGENPSAGLRL
ncbi:hypothetical protein DL96DRAFT_1780881 [Flagelloscypha sp. PMI_526]|nr:hypothetical protein DL96DRAFT_1780881 [Flagelloscypha sp. PMI_526]